MPKSFLDHAFDYISGEQKPVSFADLWNYIKTASGLSEEEALNKASRFYTNLILDGRFVTLGENLWDLRERHTFDKVHIDMKDVYSDVEASDDDSEEASEESEYNSAFEEPKVSDDEDDSNALESNSDDEEAL